MPEYPNRSKYRYKNLELVTGDNQNESEAYLHLNHFFETSKLFVESTENENNIIKVYLKSSELNVECPYCKSISHQVHSTYIRTLTDLPILGNQVSLYLKARKFFCKNITCSKKTFAEQPGNEILTLRLLNSIYGIE